MPDKTPKWTQNGNTPSVSVAVQGFAGLAQFPGVERRTVVPRRGPQGFSGVGPLRTPVRTRPISCRFRCELATSRPRHVRAHAWDGAA